MTLLKFDPVNYNTVIISFMFWQIIEYGFLTPGAYITNENNFAQHSILRIHHPYKGVLINMDSIKLKNLFPAEPMAAVFTSPAPSLGFYWWKQYPIKLSTRTECQSETQPQSGSNLDCVHSSLTC